MTHRTDAKANALRQQGHTGTVSDMTLQWLKAAGATSDDVNTALVQVLAARGQTTGTRSDRWYAFLGAQGHVGSYPDREKAFWQAGGILPPPTP